MLQHSTVHRQLDAKIKIIGFELFDLLAILILAAVMNLIFGNTSLSLPMVFVMPGCLGAVIYFGKKGKPDNHLIHTVRYHLLPGAFASGNGSAAEEKMTYPISYD